jgi:hypothetical protein
MSGSLAAFQQLPAESSEKPEPRASRDGRTWDRTRDLSRVKRALSR